MRRDSASILVTTGTKVVRDVVPIGGTGVVAGSSVDSAVVDEAVTNVAILVRLQRGDPQDFCNTQREKNRKAIMSVRIRRLEQYAQVNKD